MGVITGLGLQRRSLTATIVSSLASLLCAALLVPLPQVRLFGAAMAAMLGQVISVGWNAAILRRAKQE